MGKGWSFQWIVLEKWDSYKQKNETRPLYYKLFKNQLKVKVLKVRPKFIKFLEANIVDKLLFLAIFFFSNLTPKAKATKTNINKWNYVKLQHSTKDSINKTKRQSTEWRKDLQIIYW